MNSDKFNKLLLIMRHGKAKGIEAGGGDFDRRLRKRGLRDAARMGEVLLEKEWVPDLIVTSSAERGVMTADAVAEGCGYSGEILQLGSLYLGTAEQYKRVLEDLEHESDAKRGEDVSGGYGRVMMIGHQPVLSDLVYALTRQSVEMVTGSVAVIGFGVDSWSEFANYGTGNGQLLEFFRPSEMS